MALGMIGLALLVLFKIELVKELLAPAITTTAAMLTGPIRANEGITDIKQSVESVDSKVGRTYEKVEELEDKMDTNRKLMFEFHKEDVNDEQALRSILNQEASVDDVVDAIDMDGPSNSS